MVQAACNCTVGKPCPGIWFIDPWKPYSWGQSRIIRLGWVRGKHSQQIQAMLSLAEFPCEKLNFPSASPPWMCDIVLQRPCHVLVDRYEFCHIGVWLHCWDRWEQPNPQCSWHGWQLCYRSVLNQLHELKSGTELLSHAQFQSVWCLCSWSLHEEWVSHVQQECVHWGSVPCSEDKAFDSAKHYVRVVPAILFLLQAQQLCISSWPCIQLSPVTSQVHPLLRRSSFLMDPTIIKELIGKNPDVCSSVISCTCIVLSWMFLCVHLSPLSSFSISVCLFPLLLLSTFAS